MPRPLELCLEDLAAAPGDPEFLRCVALAGGEPGLTLHRGSIGWRAGEGADAELWISLDEQLILRRRAGGLSTRVVRSGRALDAPEGKPVVLRDQDELETAGRRFRVHVHGLAAVVHAPQPLFRKAWAPIAAAVLGAAACTLPSNTKTPEPIQVRDMPPAPPPPHREPAADAGTPAPAPDANSTQ